MKTRHHRIRIAVIAAASFFLLVTVLPEIASGLGLTQLANRLAVTSAMSCSSGSASSSSSSSCCPGSSSTSSSTCSTTGTVSGSVKVTGAPKGFSPAYEGAGACPISAPPGKLCANPEYALANNGNYSLTLTAGSWRVAGFYENNAFGGAFIGSSVVVNVPAGGTITENLTVPYSPPAAMKGTLSVRNVPTNEVIFEVTLLICPSFAPYHGGPAPIACVSAYANNPAPTSTPGSVSGSYSLTGLPPGQWVGYAGFCGDSGCITNSTHGKAFTLVAGRTSTIDFGTNFLLKDQSLLTGTINVTGAPVGFSDTVGITACESGTSTCQNVYEYELQGGTYDLVLNAGVWNVKGFYLASPYDNAIDGPTQTVVLTGDRQIVVLPINIPYQVPATATGTITVKNIPSGVKVTSYTMLACPASEPWYGGIPAPECVSEYSGPGGYGYGAADRNQVKNSNPALRPPTGVTGQAKAPYNVYSLPTLTSGVWLLYPGYQTVFGSVVDPTAKAVTLTSGQTTRHNITVPYQQPAQGAVTGTVNVVGAPGGNYFEAGVEACTAPPTSTSCAGERDSYSQQNGSYTALLPPGTWWLAGFVYLYGSSGLVESTSAPKMVNVAAGTELKKSFTVTVS
jgi:hypothetical protein